MINQKQNLKPRSLLPKFDLLVYACPTSGQENSKKAASFASPPVLIHRLPVTHLNANLGVAMKGLGHRK